MAVSQRSGYGAQILVLEGLKRAAAKPVGDRAEEGSRDRDPLRLYSVGHSTRTIAEFVDLLRPAGVEVVVDVRRLPKSRTDPHYNLDRLPALLAAQEIGHEYIAELSGRRGRSADVAAEVNAF